MGPDFRPSPPGSAILAGLRFLVVEDEAVVAIMLEDMLTDLGCAVVSVAGDVAHGVALAENRSFELDAAVLDINLGGEKVYPVAERLLARRIPFIFSTGYGRSGIPEEFAHINVLAKPFGASALGAMLCSTLAGAAGA